MDYKAISKAILLCGSEPSVKRCEKECHYYKGGDTKKCIPRMTEDAATAITSLLARAKAEEAESERWEKTAKNWEHNWNQELKLRREAEARAKKAERELNSLLEDEESAPFDPFGVAKEE